MSSVFNSFVAVNNYSNQKRFLTMMNTINSMTNFINECNISFSSGNLSSDTELLLLLDFLNNSSFLSPYESLPYADSRSKIHTYNSNHSIFTQQVIRFLTGFNAQADQSILKNDSLLSRYFSQFSSQSSVSRFFSRISEKMLNSFWDTFTYHSCSQIDRICD